MYDGVRTGKPSGSKVGPECTENRRTLLAHLWLLIVFCTQNFLDESTLDIVREYCMKECGPPYRKRSADNFIEVVRLRR